MDERYPIYYFFTFFGGMNMCGCLLLLLAFIIFVIGVVALIFSTIAFVVKAAISFGCILLVVFIVMIILGGTR